MGNFCSCSECVPDVQEPTHMVCVGAHNVVFVKTFEFFIEQGGLTEPWGANWKPVYASSIGDARRQGARLFEIQLSPIYNDEE